jgi:hypothetical protein
MRRRRCSSCWRESGKVATFGEGVRLVQRRDASLDYWEGEP